jgi:uncharacterized membrane protein HdeD (DUF308 family)
MADMSSSVTGFVQEVKKNWGLVFFMGIMFVIAGILAIGYPHVWTTGIILMIGWILAITGLIRLFDALFTMKQGGFAWKIIGSILYILAGIIILKFPLTGSLTITFIIGTFLIIEGISKSAFAADMKPLPGWTWAMFDGVVSIVFGAVILIFLPATALWLIGLMLGIKLLLAGWDLIFFGLALKRA